MLRAATGLLFAALVFGPHADAAETKKLKLKRGRWESFLICPLGPSNRFEPGRAIKCGPHEVVFTLEQKGARVSWSGGARAGNVLIPTRKPRKTIKMGVGRDVVSLYVFADDLGQWHHLNPVTRVGVLHGQTIHFFDTDFDGTWMEPGVDWWALAGARHALVCQKEIIVHDHHVRVAGFDVEKSQFTYETEDLAASLAPGAREGFQTINDVRTFYGLPGCILDPARSKDCRKHARWCVLNKAMSHFEAKGTPGYSEEGDRAGQASILSDRGTPSGCFFGLFDTPLHGYPLSAPYYTRTAVAFEKPYIVVWWQEGDEFPMSDFDEKRPAIFPPHGATGIPITWDAEVPDPRKGDRSYSWGYPIRIYLQKRFRSRFIKITDVKVKLAPLGTEAAVPVQVIPDGDEFLILPRVPLKARTTYHFLVTWTERSRGARRIETTFTTGRQAGQRRSALEK